jgi:hypothetical protein
LNWYLVVWIRWNAWLPTEARNLHQASEQRAEHEWGDVIPMPDDALGDRGHDAETTWYCDVGGVSRGDAPFRIAGGPRGAARRLGTHCNATPCFEPVCSAVAGWVSPLHSNSGQHSWFPTLGSAAGWREGIWCGLGRSSAQNAVGLHRPTHLHMSHVSCLINTGPVHTQQARSACTPHTAAQQARSTCTHTRQQRSTAAHSHSADALVASPAALGNPHVLFY